VAGPSADRAKTNKVVAQQNFGARQVSQDVNALPNKATTVKEKSKQNTRVVEASPPADEFMEEDNGVTDEDESAEIEHTAQDSRPASQPTIQFKTQKKEPEAFATCETVAENTEVACNSIIESS
jgi:hypothetical protein